MKNLIYRIYALFFNIGSKLLKTDKNLVAFVSMHNENFNDSLGAVFNELKKDKRFRFLFVSKRDLNFSPKGIFRLLSFFFKKSFLLSKASCIFLNDNFLPMSRFNIKSDVKVVRLWHAEGAFKKFGFAIDRPEEVRKNEIAACKKITHVVCSSKGVAPIYAEAFAVDEKNVLPLGVPRTDFFFESGNTEKSRKKLERLYPRIKGKRLVLYAPTFRGDKKEDSEILDHFEIEKLSRLLGDDYVLAIRLHPQIHCESEKLKDAINLTDYPDVRELTLACDVCVTDYSSICMGFSMLDKKSVFFAYDLDYYKGSRDFYFDFEEYVPGKIAKTTEELAEAIKAPLDTEKNNKFKNFNFDNFDGKSAERVVEKIIG